MEKSVFDVLVQLPEDPILTLSLTFAAEKRKHKVNLGVGAYQDEEGNSVVFECIKQAEHIIMNQHLDKAYLPIIGEKDFLKEMGKLVFGEEVFEKIAPLLSSIQTLGGTGALHLGAEFLVRNGFTHIAISDPTWANHHLILKYARANTTVYPYYDSMSHYLNFNKTCETISKMNPNQVMLLHASCHNPTGRDFSYNEWNELSALMKRYQVIPFFDLAYQGFGESLEKDVEAIRLFVKEGHEMLVAVSCSKNFGMYGERVGALFMLTHSLVSVSKIASHLKELARSSYSNPPLYGVRVIKTVLQNKELNSLWRQELLSVKERIIRLRKSLVDHLKRKNVNLDFLLEQKGMFSYTDLNVDQVKRLKEEFAIYTGANGRINIAGLNSFNLSYVASSIASIL